jgi:predicted alpha/beta-hydrolase family hydrolase
MQTSPVETEGRFLATAEKGEVCFVLVEPPEATWCLVLGHGASSHFRHRTVASIASALAGVGIASFRYNFPYSERGGGRNSNEVCIATTRSAVEAAHTATPRVSLLAGGHSFSGRMTSLGSAKTPLPNVRGLVFYAFPLHPAGKPGTERAEHLADVEHPMLFLSGSRDALAELELLKPVCSNLGDRATLHLLDTADHSFKILKRSRQTTEDVYDEMARTVLQWVKML